MFGWFKSSTPEEIKLRFVKSTLQHVESMQKKHSLFGKIRDDAMRDARLSRTLIPKSDGSFVRGEIRSAMGGLRDVNVRAAREANWARVRIKRELGKDIKIAHQLLDTPAELRTS
ncbi:MAG: hypothetical protein AAB573_03475 [Patescibacteria group bacterium]